MIIVTGYTGFIGKNYIKKSALAKKILPIKRNLSKINKIKNKNIVIVNFAALYQKKSFFKDVKKIVDSNYTYPIRVIESLINNNNNITFFNISSYFQLKENKRKSNLYSVVKNSFKNILKFYETKGKFNFYNVYLYDVFGTGDKRNKIFRQIILSYQSNKVLKVLSPYNYLVPVHIDTVVKILDLYIADKNRPKEIHINQKEKIFVKDICEISRYAFPKIKIKYKDNKKKDFLYKKNLTKYKIIRNLKNDLINFFSEYA
tara:strand:- start:3149 stop:3925 length:777 start_codon:yes stop_codon:yes gene_type:complete